MQKTLVTICSLLLATNLSAHDFAHKSYAGVNLGASIPFYKADYKVAVNNRNAQANSASLNYTLH